VLIEQNIIIRWQNFQIKFTIPTDQLVNLTAPFENSKWPPAEVKVCIETLWETTFSFSS
jgi:hypothetical protein